MKRILALTLALGMAVSLVGCGGASSSSATASGASSEMPEIQVDTTTEWNVQRPEGLTEDYPNKEIKFIYPFNSSGSTTVVYLRIMFEKIKQMEGWDYSIVLEQKEGASGDIGWTAAAEADGDGYSFTFAPTSMMITAIGEDRPYTGDAFKYICNLTTSPGVIAVSADSSYNTLNDFLEAAAANPGTVSIGVTSVSGGEGVAVLQLEQASGADLNMVPFNSGTEIIAAVSGGHCEALCLNTSDVLPYVEDGTLKVLAVGSSERCETFPDAPTYQECGYDVIQANSRALAAPASTDEAIIQYLSDCFEAAHNSADVQEQIANISLEHDFMPHEEAQAMFEEAYESYLEQWNTNPWT